MQAIAQLPSGSQELTVSKLLPEKHIACQLTKGGEEKSLQIVVHPLFLSGEGVFLALMSPDPETQGKICDYKHLWGGAEGR